MMTSDELQSLRQALVSVAPPVVVAPVFCKDAFLHREYRALREIALLVCGVFRVDYQTLLSPSRKHHTATARHVTVWLARRLTGLSYPQIAGFFSKRDHSTAIHSVRVIERRRESAPVFAAGLTKLEGQLRLELQYADEEAA